MTRMPRAAATAARMRIAVSLLAAERPELVPDEVELGHEHDRHCLRGHLPDADRDEHAEHDEVRAEREQRDDEEAEPLVVEMAAVAAEGPEPVPRVVARDGDGER